MDWIKENFKKSLTETEEQSLEEQVKIWQLNINDNDKIKNIIFPVVKKPAIPIDEHVYNDLEFFSTHDGDTGSVSNTLGKDTSFSKTEIPSSILLLHSDIL